MKVFVAGATGAIGRRIVGRLAAGGHDVVGLTRSSSKASTIEELGGRAVVGDVLDAPRVEELFGETKPEGVIQVLNALPQRGAFRPADLAATNELRIKGTHNLLAAALAHGARRYVAESMIFVYGYGDHGPSPIAEDHPVMTNPDFEPARAALDALLSLERQVLDASASGSIGGIVLRYGLFYGPDIGSTEFMARMLKRRMMGLPGGGDAVASWIHIDDGAAAAVAALASDRSGEIYNVVDDEPASLRSFTTELAARRGLPKPYKVPLWTARLMGKQMALTARSRLAVSNRKIRSELGWKPAYPSYREGLATLVPTS